MKPLPHKDIRFNESLIHLPDSLSVRYNWHNFCDIESKYITIMKKIFTLSLLFIYTFIIAQNSNNDTIDKYEKVFYFEKSIEQNNYNVLIKNIVDYKEGIKFALKLTNKISDFILFDPEESKVLINKTKLDFIGKSKLIAPSKTKGQTINVEKKVVKRENDFNIILEGLTVLNENESSIDVKNFEIPMVKKDFSFKDVYCKVSIPIRKSQKMTVKIELRNKGNDYIIIYPYRVGVKMPDGRIYTSKNTKKTFVLAPRGKKSISLKWDRMPKGNLNDMQKVDMEITFKDVFFNVKEIKLDPLNIEIKWNKKFTIEKN